MLYSTRGIALHYHKYNDNSIILKAYTQMHGLKAYFVRIKQGGKQNLSYFQPLTLLNITAYSKETNQIQNLKEVSLADPSVTFSGDVVRSSIAVFIAEVFTRSVKHEEYDDAMYSFLENTINHLHTETNLALFPHAYLLGLSKFLGFAPSDEGLALPYFDLLSGRFTAAPPPHPHFTSGDETHIVAAFIGNFIHGTALTTQLTRPAREALLNRLIEYFRLHVEALGQIKSHFVLREALS